MHILFLRPKRAGRYWADPQLTTHLKEEQLELTCSWSLRNKDHFEDKLFLENCSKFSLPIFLALLLKLFTLNIALLYILSKYITDNIIKYLITLTRVNSH